MKCAIIPVTPFQQNCSILVCQATKKAAVVDPGGELEKIDAALKQLDVTLEKVLLTHGHMDHCAIADDVRKLHNVPIEGPHEDDRFWIEKLPESCEMSGFPHANAFEPDRWLKDGDRVSFGNQTLQVLHALVTRPVMWCFFIQSLNLPWWAMSCFRGQLVAPISPVATTTPYCAPFEKNSGHSVMRLHLFPATAPPPPLAKNAPPTPLLLIAVMVNKSALWSTKQ